MAIMKEKGETFFFRCQKKSRNRQVLRFVYIHETRHMNTSC
jgi:hypothetical protein